MQINTKILMIASVLTLGITGVLLNFLPQEIGQLIGVNSPLVMQLLGAAYFGFAMANWTAKSSLMGGIYGRAVAIGNFSHFMIGAFALLKLSAWNEPFMLGLTVVYTVFAVLFGVVFFTHPKA